VARPRGGMVNQSPLSFGGRVEPRVASWPAHQRAAEIEFVVDEPGERDVLTLGLEMAGYQVDLADDGEAGLIIAAARAPVAAIIDLRVPIIDGWLLAESLRGVFGEQIRSLP
jgi:CheY-like chemotaxis protein